MATEISNENSSPADQTRVLPEWMTKRHASRNIGPITSTETNSTQENCSAKIEKQDVKEEKLCQIVNENSVQSKAHQLSDDEEEEEEKIKEEERVCEEQEKVCIKKNDVCKEQNRVPGEDDSTEKEEEIDAVGEEVLSGEASTQSQDSNESGIQKITWRVLCNYGAECYRKNPDHKKDYCHPWDDDYDTVLNNLPACQYGAGCYRKNKAHWQTHSHRPTTSPTRPAKRTRKRATTPPAATSSDLEEDDYDSADSFLNDASSDDYQPTGSDSNSDVSNDEDDDDEPDAKRMKKEAKKFLRKKK